MVLFDNRFSLQSGKTITEQELIHTVTSSEGSTLWETAKYIYPLITKPITVLDGTIFGQSEYRLYNTGAGKWLKLEKLEVMLKAIDSNANERQLIDLYTADNINWQTAGGGDETGNVNFFMHINNQKITVNERLLLEMSVYGSGYAEGIHPSYVYRNAYANTDDQNINIPIV